MPPARFLLPQKLFSQGADKRAGVSPDQCNWEMVSLAGASSHPTVDAKGCTTAYLQPLRHASLLVWPRCKMRIQSLDPVKCGELDSFFSRVWEFPSPCVLEMYAGSCGGQKPGRGEDNWMKHSESTHR